MIRAVIFDLDGTLVDTEPLHFAAFNEALRPEGISISYEDYLVKLIGFNDRDCLSFVMRQHGKDTSVAKISELIARKAVCYQAIIAERDVLIPGAEKFVRDCAERFPLMIVTGTLRAEAELILRRAKLRELFVDIIAAEDVERGKPEPDGFVEALGRIGFLLRQRDPVMPEECLVVEDTVAGLESARRAKMKVLAVCHSSTAAELAAADVIRPALLGLDLDDVLRALRGAK